MKHTPGPWEVKNKTSVISGDNQIASTGFKMGGWPKEEFEKEIANARLIAAAPELLEVLKTIAAMLPSSEGLGGHAPMSAFIAAGSKVRQAIAKAEGDQK